MFSKLFWIHQLHLTHQFNRTSVYFVLNVIILFGDMLQPNCLKEFISSDVIPFVIISTLLYFTPICCSFCSFIISCCIFPVCYLNGLILTHEVNSDYVLVNEFFCYISTWEECRFCLHVTFFTTQPFSKLDLFRAIFLHIVTMILQSCPFTLVLLYQQYNCSVVSRRLHDMTSVVLALWRHLHVLRQIDCFLSHRHSRRELHCLASFICPPWVVTDLAIAFHCVFWSSV